MEMETDRLLAPLVAVEDLTVIRNLETALEEETKTFTAYKAYAARADEEGYHGVASLFRATARAEQIHASNHARVLRYMGASAMIEVPKPRLDDTLENLKSAFVDQKFEVDYLYPTFLTSAVPLFDSTAIRTFHWALEADKSHVRLYSGVMPLVNANDKSGWAQTEHAFFVCALCGYAVQNPEGENCPGCNYLWEKFETVR
jgi:rubrerythrin